MSAGHVLKSPIVKRVREEKDFGTMNRKDFVDLCRSELNLVVDVIVTGH